MKLRHVGNGFRSVARKAEVANGDDLSTIDMEHNRIWWRSSALMRTVVVRYQVGPEAAAENERLIRQVFEQLAREQPQGLRYQSLKLLE